jgi:hypothetical protein
MHYLTLEDGTDTLSVNVGTEHRSLMHNIPEERTSLRPVCLPACLPAHLSVRMEQRDSHCMDFHEISYSSIFSKTSRENSRFIKASQE